ncbi:hyaluronidase B isoform X2 [Nilaparvata lugens]|uniref:hyaluronidase B isoform X2 n=1 Tax=Nilaparvata lugens TaxID=108931 RepID=UPI000B98CD1D|nr:hyaluronidase B isoform X2 [Nilaparvata lugens]
MAHAYNIGLLLHCICMLCFLFARVANVAAAAKYKVLWNVPTFMCHKHGLNFSSVSEQWGLLQNRGDQFRGNAVALLYDPGLFPALLDATRLTPQQPRNGGVPQAANLTKHLHIYRNDIERLIPDAGFKGIAIIDFEHWRPIWRENWGSLNSYRIYSRNLVKKSQPWLSESAVEKEATTQFEKAAKSFLLTTLQVSKQLRPLAKWGYYGYPFCFNYKLTGNNKLSCTEDVIEDNNRLKWFFDESTALYPSLYLKNQGMTEEKRAKFMIGRMEEAYRLSHKGKFKPVFPYTWYKYHDVNRFLSREDLINSLEIPKKKGSNGVIIWGATNDVNTKEKCLALLDYVDRILGPTVKIVKQRLERWERIKQKIHFNESIDPNEVEKEVILVR